MTMSMEIQALGGAHTEKSTILLSTEYDCTHAVSFIFESYEVLQAITIHLHSPIPPTFRLCRFQAINPILTDNLLVIIES